MATKLKNLVLDELSFVDKGANRHATVTIFKRAEPVAAPITKNCGCLRG